MPALLAHHGPVEWLWLVLPVVLVVAWVHWAERRSRTPRTSDRGPRIEDTADREPRTAD